MIMARYLRVVAQSGLPFRQRLIKCHPNLLQQSEERVFSLAVLRIWCPRYVWEWSHRLLILQKTSKLNHFHFASESSVVAECYLM